VNPPLLIGVIAALLSGLGLIAAGMRRRVHRS
jgi:hypothetical protein